MKKVVLAALGWVVSLAMHPSAHSQELIATFETGVLAYGPGPIVIPGGTVTLELKPNGTIFATAQTVGALNLLSVGLNSKVDYETYGFSASNVEDTQVGTSFGYFDTAWIGIGGQMLGNTTLTWSIGAPGTFDSVYDVLGGSRSSYDAFLYVMDIQTSALTEYAANFTAVGSIPEPETYSLMIAGLAAVGLAARRRNRGKSKLSMLLR